MSTPHAFQQFSAFWDKLFAENPKKLRHLVTRVTRFLDVWEWEEFSRFLIRKNLILLISSVWLVQSALSLRIRSPRFREVSGIGTISTVITIVLPIWGNSYNTLLYSSKVKWSWSMCLFYSQYEIISPRHIFLFFIPIALFFFPTLYLYILLIRRRKNLSRLLSPAYLIPLTDKPRLNTIRPVPHCNRAKVGTNLVRFPNSLHIRVPRSFGEPD